MAQRQRLIAATKQDAPFYRGKEWRRLRKALVEKNGRICAACGRSADRVFADHIRELKDSGAPLNPGNLQLLCAPCHTSKTVAARKARYGVG